MLSFPVHKREETMSFAIISKIFWNSSNKGSERLAQLKF